MDEYEAELSYFNLTWVPLVLMSLGGGGLLLPSFWLGDFGGRTAGFLGLWLLLLPLAAYETLTALFNRWTIRANRELVEVEYGPIPGRGGRRAVPVTRIASVEMNGDGNATALWSTAGISVRHPDGESTPLVWGCGDGRAVRRVQRELEAFLDVYPALTAAERAVRGL